MFVITLKVSVSLLFENIQDVCVCLVIKELKMKPVLVGSLQAVTIKVMMSLSPRLASLPFQADKELCILAVFPEIQIVYGMYISCACVHHNTCIPVKTPSSEILE